MGVPEWLFCLCLPCRIRCRSNRCLPFLFTAMVSMFAPPFRIVQVRVNQAHLVCRFTNPTVGAKLAESYHGPLVARGIPPLAVATASTARWFASSYEIVPSLLPSAISHNLLRRLKSFLAFSNVGWYVCMVSGIVLSEYSFQCCPLCSDCVFQVRVRPVGNGQSNICSRRPHTLCCMW